MGVPDSDDNLSRIEELEKKVERLDANLKAVHEKLETKATDEFTDSAHDLKARSLCSDLYERLNKLLQEKETRDSLSFAPAADVKRLSNAVNGKVSWSDFQNGLRRIDEMRVFLETAAEKVFIGHKQFVLEELDKKADAEAVIWGLRAKGDDSEVKALRARVEHLERLHADLFRDVDSIRTELNYFAEQVAPAVVRNTTVCKIMWDLLGLSDPTAKRLLNEADAPPVPVTFPKTPRTTKLEGGIQEGHAKTGEARGSYLGSKGKRRSSSTDYRQPQPTSTSTETVRTEQDRLLPGSRLWPQFLGSSWGLGKQWNTMQNNAGTRPGVTEARSPRYSGSGQDFGAHTAETNSNAKPHAATNEEDLHQLEGGANSEESPEDNTGCLRHSSGIWIEPESRSDGSSLFADPAPKGVTAPVPPTTPRQTRLLPKQPIAVKKDTTARARAIDADAMASSAAREGRKETSLSLVRPAQAPQRRQGILQRLAELTETLELMQEKGRSTAQESARGFSFCDRCGLPRGTKNCHACESLSLQPGQQQMNPQWEARDDHQIGHLLRHGQALSFFPPLQCISKVRLWLIFRIETVISPRRCCRVLCPKILFSTPRRWGIWMWITLCICFGVVVFYLQTSHADAAFCCYPRYLEYCLELVEEKFAVVEEKLEILMEFADSINKKRSSEEERRLASLDWMVKEVLKRLTFCSYFQRSPRAHHIDQGVIQRDATGTSLPGVHIVASPDDSSPEIWQNKAGRVAGSGRATPVNQCHGNQREPEREPSKGSLREATKDIFAWLPKQKSDSFSETCVPLFGKRNKNEEPDCSSLAALVARDLRQTETNEEPQVLPGVTSPSFWKKANWKT